MTDNLSESRKAIIEARSFGNIEDGSLELNQSSKTIIHLFHILLQLSITPPVCNKPYFLEWILLKYIIILKVVGQTKFNMNVNWFDFNATREVIFESKIMQEKGSFLIHFTSHKNLSLFRGG